MKLSFVILEITGLIATIGALALPVNGFAEEHTLVMLAGSPQSPGAIDARAAVRVSDCPPGSLWMDFAQFTLRIRRITPCG
jgi:hypothetical protein